MSKICEPHSVPTTRQPHVHFMGLVSPEAGTGTEVKRWYFGHLPQILGVVVGRILHRAGGFWPAKGVKVGSSCGCKMSGTW